MRTRARRGLAASGLALASLALVVAIGAPLGLFSGQRPADLGVAGGKLRGGDGRPNWVSSQVPAADGHHVAPIATGGDPARAWRALETAVRGEPGSTVVTRGPAYLHAEFASRLMGFVDDAEFALDREAGVIHLRAGARLGIRDFGVNRERMERLRAAVAAARD